MTLAVHGFPLVLLVLAALAFLVATIVAWWVPPASRWGALIAAGLCLATIATIFR
jgi:hypothetical protein